MPEPNDDPEIACTLTPDHLAERPDEIEGALSEAFVEATELDDGYELEFEGTESTLRAAGRFVSYEHVCCDFAEYELSVSPPYERTSLVITGPEGIKDMFGTVFLDRLRS